MHKLILLITIFFTTSFAFAEMTPVEREYLNDIKSQNTELKNQVEQNQRDIFVLKQHVDEKNVQIDLSNRNVDRAINIIMLFLAVAGVIATIVSWLTKRRATKLLDELEQKYKELVKEFDNLKSTLDNSKKDLSQHQSNVTNTINENNVLFAKQRKDILKMSSDFKNLPEYDLTAENWFNKGYVLSDKGLHNDAIKAYDKAIELRPQFAEAWNNKGISLDNKGSYNEAINAYDEAIKINPEFAEAWNNKGISLDNKGSYNEAINAYDEAIKINPTFANAWIGKADTIRKLANTSDKTDDKLNEALKLVDKAIELDAKSILPYETKAEILYDMKNYKEALDWINKALAIDSTRQYSIDLKKKIEGAMAQQENN